MVSGLMRSFLDLAGLALLFPVIQILLTPQIVQESRLLKTLYDAGSYSDPTKFAFSLMALVVLFFIIKTIVGFFLTHYQAKASYNIAEELACTRFHSYLSMPYSFYLQNNSGVLMRNFLVIPFEFAHAIIISFIQLASELVLLFLLLIIIVIYKPLMFLALAAIMIPVVYLYQKKLKHYLKEISDKKDSFGKYLYKLGSQSMSLYREIILHNKRDYFDEKYKSGVEELARQVVRVVTINEYSPKITELIAVMGIGLVFALSAWFQNGSGELVQFLIVFALVISRLLPSVNRIILYTTTIRSSIYVFEHLEDIVPTQNSMMPKAESLPLSYERDITIRDLSFTHDNSSQAIFTNLNLTIEKGSSIGLVGPSGSGKTTLLNLLLRLLEESSGGIYIDDVKLTESNKQAWYALIGFVPQNINLIDGNFIENIAFGIPMEQVDQNRLAEVVDLAQLTNLIRTQPEEYYTQIGEGGLKISGGQRQRIGIARALYHNAQILIFDEATSALDMETEEMITESLRVLSKNKLTTIVVAHRIQTLKYCDTIYKIDQGKLGTKMKFSDL